MCNMGNIVKKNVISFYENREKQTYTGDNFALHRNSKSSCYTTVTNTVQDNYTSKKQRNSSQKRLDLWLPEAGVREEGELDQGGQKVKISSYKK